MDGAAAWRAPESAEQVPHVPGLSPGTLLSLVAPFAPHRP